MPTPEQIRDASGQHAVIADKIFDGSRWHAHAAVLIKGGRIQGIAAPGDILDDWPQRRLPIGAILAPGFIDLQVNGGGGMLLNDSPTADTMHAIARVHREYGTTACLPTMITDTREQMQRAIAGALKARAEDGVVGVHLEGPFISPARRGIHRQDLIATASDKDLEWLLELAAVKGSVVTLAPECVPAGFINRLARAGVRVSLGHTEASAEIISRAADDGATGVTHLFNAMPPMTGRQPGPVGAALADRRLTAGLIVDGIHVDPIAIRAAFAAKGPDGVALISDAMPTVGATAKEFSLMGRVIKLEGGRLAAEDGTLGGAHLDMASAVRNAVTVVRLPLDDALRAASHTPAKFLGQSDECGVIQPGARADMVALTPDLHVVATWMRGAVQMAGTH
ncbi:MAG: N-acetylglucosamine-6-phosphate deacetylase [Alphaproteobacteria bacterium]|nr:N-acetylglucosamine-6-phosphate deacetylase [Alphaproteobacteria bacterium]